jgi:osmotically-inducible protein OsmY
MQPFRPEPDDDPHADESENRWILDDDNASFLTDEIDDVLVEEVAGRFLTDTDIRGRHVQVSVQNCVVILQGSVESEAAKEAAGRQAWATPGVFDVCNMLVPDR